MTIDHAGIIFFPNHQIFRIIGRLAFPIFAYCISEGFFYTRSRLKYFLRIFIVGILCQIVYTIAERDLYLGILITFSLSIIIMFFLENVITAFKSGNSYFSEMSKKLFGKSLPQKYDRVLSTALLTLVVIGVYILCLYVDVDYGFFGVMLPVFTGIYKDKPRRLVMFAVSLIAVCIDTVQGGLFLQFWSLLTVPIIAAYNGTPGKYRMKNFFYIFYPAHLAILYGLDWLIG